MLQNVKDLIAKQLRVEVSSIGDDSNIMEDLGADSLDVVDLLMAVEENFGVTVPDEDVPSLKTVRNIADYIETHETH